MPPRPRLLFVVNNAAFFVSHRLPIALRARERGYDVRLLTGHAGSPLLEQAALHRLGVDGIFHTRVAFRSGGLNPARELLGWCQLLMQMLKWRPDVVHCASPKALVYGGLAARVARVPSLVLAVSGLGYVYTDGDAAGVRRLVRRVVDPLMRFALGHRNKVVIVQNQDDFGALSASALVDRRQLQLIPGSGVRLEDYVSLPIEGRARLVVLPARLLRDKGVVEFVEAARRLKPRFADWRFALVGTADYHNPSAIAEQVIDGWVKEGVVEWWGHVEDMASVYAQAGIVCLPSYREGMPKSLLEAAAAGCAVVTTDTTGCREAVRAGSTGELVPVGDSARLADALARLMADPTLCMAYGRAGRQLAIQQFDLEAVLERILAIYSDLRAHANA